MSTRLRPGPLNATRWLLLASTLLSRCGVGRWLVLASTLLSGCSAGDQTSSPTGSPASSVSSSGSAGGAGGAGGEGPSATASAGGSGGAAQGAGGGGGAAQGTGSGGGAAQGAGGSAPVPLFDIPMIEDASTAQCAFTSPRNVQKDGVSLDVWNVSYVSWESIGGELQPIVIRAFAARPAGQNGSWPGVVFAHGLGGFADEDSATSTAARLGTFVLAYTGPGGGTTPENTSEGLPPSEGSFHRLFDTIPDTRGTWIWGHAVAAMRGLTCLAARPDVDADRLGMSGYSAGGVATLIVAGVDRRVKAAVPLSATHAWSESVKAPHAWQHPLLTAAGLTTDSPEWQKLQADIIDPAATVAHAQAKILMVNGSSDEFFPLTAHLPTYAAIPGVEKRTSLVGNFDHGCYALTGGESADTIGARALLHADGGQKMWFSHWFGTGTDYAHVPAEPTVTLTAVGALTLVTAAVDGGGDALDVEEVKIWWSNDDAFLWGSIVLEPQGGGAYSSLTALPLQANTVSYVDVVYKTKSFLAPERFSVSSPPALPPGFVPHVRDQTTCL